MSEHEVVTIDGGEPASTPAPAPEGDVPVIVDGADDKSGIPARAIRNADGSITLPLCVPVVLRWRGTDTGAIKEEAPVERVTFRRLSGKDVRVIMNAGAGDAFMDELTAASVRAQFPSKHIWRATFGLMDGADAAASIRIAQSFLESGPQTPGPNASPR